MKIRRDRGVTPHAETHWRHLTLPTDPAAIDALVLGTSAARTLRDDPGARRWTPPHDGTGTATQEAVALTEIPRQPRDRPWGSLPRRAGLRANRLKGRHQGPVGLTNKTRTRRTFISPLAPNGKYDDNFLP